ncbi:hypothetical protein SCHPADRAFT_817086 [Schizopora paradoxa]|uniref:tRNA (guanine(37)-N1)-methyltransferase n=1 Tax=Schizopora paradoxa TaxID=27342 RepID=A0A0H2S766_9AGAM|nr:hypothetical protein SCHPADRAFT_817086 [Schizopora paradoxa]
MAHHSCSNLDTSPTINRITAGTTAIDKDAYTKNVRVQAIRIAAPKTGKILRSQELKGLVLELPKFSSVVREENDDSRLVLLQAKPEDALPSTALKFVDEEGGTIVPYNFSLKYDYWTADEILQATLPEELREESPTGFAITGHIAHFNLRDEYLPFKKIIGEIVIDKNKRIRTVVNKLDNIHNEFRFFEMELVAGDADYVVEHHESDCKFTFDFREVYWNSRLHTEHERLVSIFKPEDGIIADVFAGVGPFAVPAAKKGCAVLANDLNPNSVKWLNKNSEDNKVGNLLRASCEDGRDFIRGAARRAYDEPFAAYAGPKPNRRQVREERRRRLEQQGEGAARPEPDDTVTVEKPPRNRIAHFVMNLPDTAIDFLDAFRGVLSRDLRGVYSELPMVHCHCFTRFLDLADARADIEKRVESALGASLRGNFSLHFVRSVAPNKDMYCISFRLPEGVAFQ